MIRKLGIGVLLFTATLAFAQSGDSGDPEKFTVSGDLTAVYTLGNAEISQAIGGSGYGAYNDEKNGYYTAANVYFNLKPVDFIEAKAKLYAYSRNGSFYEPLQLEYLASGDFALSFDYFWGRASLFEAAGLNLPVNLFLQAGKYKRETSYFGKISKYETESVLYMLKTGTSYNYQLEAVYKGTENNPFLINGLFVSNYKFDEATKRLYDKDGSVAKHGDIVIGEYAPQLFAAASLKDFSIGLNKLSAELAYALNGADIYSGNSIGGALKFDAKLNEDINLLVGVNAGWFEKNIDILSGSAGTDNTNESRRKTTDLRDSLAAGLGVGLRFVTGDIGLDANLAGAYYNINHIYRDPLDLISFSIDAQCTYKNLILGAGFVAGSLTDAVWQTSSGVNPADDANGYKKTFKLEENMGFEVYAGLKFLSNGRFVLGFNSNKGLAMNNTLESRADGQIKYRQKDVESSDMYETGGLFIKTVMSF